MTKRGTYTANSVATYLAFLASQKFVGDSEEREDHQP